MAGGMDTKKQSSQQIWLVISGHTELFINDSELLRIIKIPTLRLCPRLLKITKKNNGREKKPGPLIYIIISLEV